MDQVPEPGERRRLSILDVCVFIAAVALGLAVVKSEAFGRIWLGSYTSPIDFRGFFRLRFALAVAYATPFLFSFSVAVPALAFRSHRGDRTRAMLQPGVASCVMVVMATLLYLIVSTTRKLFYGTLYAYDEVSHSLSGLFVDGMMDMASRAGYCVAALWVLLAVAGGGTRRSSWLDWIGRAIGVIWLVLLFAPPFKPAF